MDRGDRALQNVIAQAAGLGAQGQGSVPGSSSYGAQFIASPQYYPDSPGGSSASQAGGAGEAEAAAKQPVLSAEALLEEAEERANIQEIQVLDAKGLKRLVTAFEKKYKDNLEQRMRHADEPEKFLESEVDLDETVKGLAQVAGSPELYPLLVELNPVPTLMACLGHENTDIAADALDVLRELTDADAVEEYGEEARLLAGALLEANVLELLVQRLASLNEKVPEEAAAVFNCLHTFENLIEVQPDIAEQVVDKTRLLKWLLARLRPREFDGNKLQASELLAVLLQGSEKNQRK
ncbi:hypothetical protein QJQ45_028331 [Haematococcus lacustris]|nr:hypothetical protein QJQ45_028331 [Haematococcus lacustris]